MVLGLFGILVLLGLVIVLVLIASGRVPVLIACLTGGFYFLGILWLLRALLGAG